MRQHLLCLLLFALGFGPRAEASALDALAERLQALNGVSGNFEQALVAEDGKVLEQSRGDFRMLRPGYLAWHIREPDEQLLMASGETLWHYDVELETATRRSIPVGNPTSPLTILGGNVKLLENYYSVTRSTDDSWTLVPTFEGAEFESVELSFGERWPSQMRIRDRLGRSTRIDLVDVIESDTLTPADFDFRPPDGVDVYDNGR